MSARIGTTTPSVATPSVVAPSITTPDIGLGGAAVPVTSVEITFVGSDVFPIDVFHLRRALVGGSLSRAWASVVQGGARYVVSFRHEGSGANPVTWEPSVAGATHAYADLSAGPVTADDAAQAWADELTGLGATGVSVVGATVTIASASGLLIGARAPYDTSTRGLFGMQRDSWGGAANANQNGAMGGTGSVHQASAGTGRIVAIGMRAGGSGNVRLGIANGPTYSTTPTAFSGGVEGVSTNNGGLRLYRLPEPFAITSGSNLWQSFRGVAGGDPTLRYRPHGEGVEGRGDLTANERLLFSTTTSNPATPIYSSGAYTHGAEAGPYAIYSFMFYIYELPVAGRYPGDGGIESAYGYHGAVNTGTPGQTPTNIMVDEVVGFRMVLPAWTDATIDGATLGVAAWEAGEDFGIGLCDMGDLVYPSGATNVTVESGEPLGSTGTGFQSHTFSTPARFDAFEDYPTLMFWGGETNGSGELDTLSVLFDANAGNANAWVDRWADNGRAWCDFVEDLGAVAEYQTRGTSGGNLLAYGDPNATLPATWTGDATDGQPQNLFRGRVALSKPGITGATT